MGWELWFTVGAGVGGMLGGEFGVVVGGAGAIVMVGGVYAGWGVMVWGFWDVRNGSYFRRKRRFLVVSRPEPSVRTEYWWYCSTSTTVPDLFHFVGWRPV